MKRQIVIDNVTQRTHENSWIKLHPLQEYKYKYKYKYSEVGCRSQAAALQPVASLPSLAGGRAACPPLQTFQTFNYSPEPRALLQSNVSSRKILFPIARAAAVYCAHSGVNNSSSLRRGGGGGEASYCPSGHGSESTSRAPRHVSKDFLPSLMI